MSRSKVNNFITKEFNTIIQDSREHRAYELGIASGYFQLYKYVETEIGEEKTKEQFKSLINGTERACEYFRKLIEIDSEPNTELEIIFEAIKEKEFDVK